MATSDIPKTGEWVDRRTLEHTRYLRARFPRVSPATLSLGQLNGVEELGSPSAMRLFAAGPDALASFRRLWHGDERLPARLELECGHPLPADPPNHMPFQVTCEACGVDVGLQLVEGGGGA